MTVRANFPNPVVMPYTTRKGKKKLRIISRAIHINPPLFYINEDIRAIENTSRKYHLQLKIVYFIEYFNVNIPTLTTKISLFWQMVKQSSS